MQHACNTMIEAKWLSEILQATRPKVLALAAAGGIIFFGHREGFAGLADPPSWVVSASLVALIVGGCLATVSFATAAAKQTRVLTVTSTSKTGIALQCHRSVAGV